MGKRTFRHIQERGSTQYTFFQVPYDLIRDGYYRTLSDGARLLYGRMLDRTGLSLKNRWVDDNGDAYIVYTIEEIRSDFNWGKDKAVKCVAELTEIGLIEKKRLGMGKPNRIYVNNFFDYEEDDTDEKEPKNGEDSKKSEKPNSRSRDSRIQEVGIAEFKKSENPNSGSRESRLQEVAKAEPIQEIQNQRDTIQSIHPSENHKATYTDRDTDEIMESVKQQIGYDTITIDESYGTLAHEALETADMAADIISHIMQIPDEKNVKIGEARYTAREVKQRLATLDKEHILYVSRCMKNCNQSIRNIRAYLLTALFNAPATIQAYYDNLVQNTMYLASTG